MDPGGTKGEQGLLELKIKSAKFMPAVNLLNTFLRINLFLIVTVLVGDLPNWLIEVGTACLANGQSIS